MLANSTLLYPVQSQAKVTKLQIQTLKTSFPSLKPWKHLKSKND